MGKRGWLIWTQELGLLRKMEEDEVKEVKEFGNLRRKRLAALNEGRQIRK